MELSIWHRNTKIKSFFDFLTFKRTLVLCLLGGLVFGTALCNKIADPDLWWHLATGKHIATTNSIPHRDIFSYTASGRPWVAHEWLAEVIFYSLYVTFGLLGLTVLKAALLTATFALLLKLILKHTESLNIAISITALAAISSMCLWTERPHLFAYLILTLYLYFVFEYRADRKTSLLPLPLLMLLWVNLHGSYIVGLFILTVYLLSELIKRRLCFFYEASETTSSTQKLSHLAKITAMTFLAALINPNGIHIFTYLFAYIGKNYTQLYVDEWQSPNFHEPSAYGYGLLLIVLFATFALSKRRIDLTDLSLLLPFLTLSFLAIRNVPLFALVSAPVIAKHIKEIRAEECENGWLAAALRKLQEAGAKKTTGELPAFNWLILALLCLLVFYRAPHNSTFAQCVDRKSVPAGAVKYIMVKKMEGNMFNQYGWGGYLIYRLYPRLKVFIDGRADVYGEKLCEDYAKVHYVKSGWNDILKDYKIDFVLWNSQSPLSVILISSPDWQPVYRDSVATIFLRRKTKPVAADLPPRAGFAPTKTNS